MSGLLYASGFYTGGTNTMAIYVTGDDAVIPVGYYMHGSLTTANVFDADGVAMPGQVFSAFASAVQSALNASPSGPGYTVTHSLTTGLYTISHAVAFTLEFYLQGPEYIRAAQALGFSADRGYSTSHTSDVLPLYEMLSVISGRTDVEGPYEADDIAEESVSDGGEDFVITRKTSELLMSWVQQMEPRSAVYAHAAASFVSWQQWFRHTRGTYPFLCYDSAIEGEPSGAVYHLTAKGAVFKPRKYTKDYDGEWVVPFATRWLGRWVP